jgi:hypothetical protein
MWGFGRNTAQGLYDLLRSQGPTQPDPTVMQAPSQAVQQPVQQPVQQAAPAPAPVATPVATPDQSPSLNQTITQAMNQPEVANPAAIVPQLPTSAGITQPQVAQQQPQQYGYQPQQTQTVLDTLRQGAQIQ